MAIKQIFDFILQQLSAGSILQNIAFYALMVLMIGVVTTQFKQHLHKIPGKLDEKNFV
jgi:hypothetical protein